MEIQKLLHPDVQQYILQHEVEDKASLLLKHKSILGIPTSMVADQIAGKGKAKLKLPLWNTTNNIVYPPSVNLEQCSSEVTAAFKVKLLTKLTDVKFNRAVDLTGGFGVDSFFLSSIFKEVDYVEPDVNLFEIAKHNLTILQKGTSKEQETKIQFHNSTSENFLASIKDKYDLIFIDPSRRTKGNQKIFRLADCVPNVTQLLAIIFDKTEVLLLKASPMLDLQQGAKELKHVAKIFVVAVDNECKELLFLCRKGYEGEPTIEVVDLKSNSNRAAVHFEFFQKEEKDAVVNYSNPLPFLYEPSAALLKAGAFKLIAQRFDLKKLHQNTHLYTSEYLVADFPGKVFEIDALIKPDTKVVRQYFPEGKANVATRNYPLSPEELKKKTGVKDGGEKFLIGFSGVKEKFLAVCKRLAN
ncbi:MAG: class I SAM-dependent methyltransferase [Bacteroidia bacterium]|nr:class I SAM-dependent methyltransferase [Bacteroidia bacterium]